VRLVIGAYVRLMIGGTRSCAYAGLGPLPVI
jgi:hypothetical protein